MYLIDYHTHTRLSFDSQADPREMIRAAAAAGLKELCFTDHVDFIDVDGKPQGFGGWEAYAAQYAEAAPFAAACGLRLALGLELGEPWEDPALAEQIAAFPGVDCIIGSIHNLPLSLGGTDFYYMRFPHQDACHAVLRPYFDCMETMAAMDCWDILGHIIYPLRYMNVREQNHVTLDPYLPQLERILKTAVRTGRGIEVNTCRGETVEDWREVLALYRDCGGRVVTVSSDAHRPRDMAKGIPQAAALVKEYGFDLAVYEKRQPKLIKL